MRAVIQRVSRAAVRCGDYHSNTGPGLLVLLAVSGEDTLKDIEYMADKTVNLRIFPHEGGKMNIPLKAAGGQIMAVSQFTLYGDCSRGRRPGFDKSAGREKAKQYFDLYVEALKQRASTVRTGVFGENMEVELVNDGPVTLIMES